MRTNKEYILRDLSQHQVLIPTGNASMKLNGMIDLTETGAFIWQQVDQSKDLNEIIEKLMDEYEVDYDTAGRDTYGFLSELYIREMVYDIPELEALLNQKKEEENE